MYFQDKVVWITGASSGIGEGLAYALAKQNAKLILSARLIGELERVQQKCIADAANTHTERTPFRSMPSDVNAVEGYTAASVPYFGVPYFGVPYTLPLDMSDLDSLRAQAKTAHAVFGRIDILVNNGGIGFRGYVKDTDMAVQQRVMQVDYFGQIG